MGCCGSILHGITGIAKAAAGIDLATPEETERRRNICRKCEFAVPCVIKIGKYCRCRKCGCVLSAKTALKSESCPLSRW